ncbi:uncharacterized protein LOC133520324 [Cydia pomonella]|uniref:uncharacterized protein LOC133520324 n=1 Tax=Cydia pomonella TaxID=82600 RepID=UPI002ADE591D|nr:uncharacterized protein LOC133520324 [Cydia pomonella]
MRRDMGSGITLQKVNYSSPRVELNGAALRRVERFKYLGQWLTESLNDDPDLERERRALTVRCNMLVRSLWTSFSQRSYNAFRILMGLPRYCSASGMFADARTDDFYAIMRKRAASLLHRLQGSTNSLLNVFVVRVDCPLMRRWNQLHEPNGPTHHRNRLC